MKAQLCATFCLALLPAAGPASASDWEGGQAFEQSTVILACAVADRVEFVPFDRLGDGTRGESWMQERSTLQGSAGSFAYESLGKFYFLRGDNLTVIDADGQTESGSCTDVTSELGLLVDFGLRRAARN